MKLANRMTALLLGMLTFGFVLVGCGDDKKDDANKDGKEGTEEQTSDAGSGEAVDMKTAMLDMTKRMHGIISDIESVDDVNAAEGDITAVFDDLVDNLGAAMKGGATMQDMEGMMSGDDPEMKEWTDKMETLTKDLEAKSPEAATRLEAVMSQQGMRLMSVVMENMSADDMQKAMKDGMEKAGDAMNDVDMDEAIDDAKEALEDVKEAVGE